MSLDKGNRQKKSFDNVRGIMGISMGVIYCIIAACVVYFENIGQIHIGKIFSWLVAGLMAAYGIFRMYRGYKIMKGEGL